MIFTVAIDGPAASGKGTLARRLAAYLGFAHLDTGTLYRAVASKLLRQGCVPDNAVVAAAAALDLGPADLAASDLRTEAVSQGASIVAAIPQVRQNLLAFQRNFAAAPPGGKPGAVLDGRDIGTVICPSATAKIFLTASLEARVERRLRELQAAGADTIRPRVQAEMLERDRRDSGRATAPMQAAPDAFKLDTSNLDEDAVFSAVLAHIEALGLRRGAP
jgi:cytidylate kinase